MSACPGLGSFFFAVPSRRGGLERLEQTLRAGGNFINCEIERGFVRTRRLIESGDLSYELERRVPNFIGRNGRIEIEKVLYISAHTWEILTPDNDRGDT